MSRDVRVVGKALQRFLLAAVLCGAASAAAFAHDGTFHGLAEVFERSLDFDFEPPEPGSYSLPAIGSAPDGTLLDHKGAPQRLGEVLAGKFSLVSLVYLNCPDDKGCPLALSTLFDLFHGSAALPRLRGDLQLITLSFDPDRDTPEALDDFARPVLADAAAERKLLWRFFTAPDRAALRPILAGFGQSVDRSRDAEVLNHLLRLYLVDRQGKIRNIYGLGTIDPRLIMTDVETLLLEEAASRTTN